MIVKVPQPEGSIAISTNGGNAVVFSVKAGTVDVPSDLLGTFLDNVAGSEVEGNEADAED